MTPKKAPQASREGGYVLVTSLLLLIVVTLMAVSMFRSFGVEEKIAGNVRDKQRALQAAETAQQFAEQYLANIATIPAAITCNTPVNANTGTVQVCGTTLANPASLPWLNASNQPVGVSYAPTVPTPMTVTTTSAPGTYYATPQFYIAYLGNSSSVPGGVVYQIDAVGYGGSPSSVAVVESTFLVQSGVTCLGGC
jgi:type IV pilus assembly protein PilX